MAGCECAAGRAHCGEFKRRGGADGGPDSHPDGRVWASIGGDVAAKRYELDFLARRIEDEPTTAHVSCDWAG